MIDNVRLSTTRARHRSQWLAPSAARGDLATARRRTRQQEIRDVQARNEQHEPDSTEQHQHQDRTSAPTMAFCRLRTATPRSVNQRDAPPQAHRGSGSSRPPPAQRHTVAQPRDDLRL
jgi:hypothetical protein